MLSFLSRGRQDSCPGPDPTRLFNQSGHRWTRQSRCRYLIPNHTSIPRRRWPYRDPCQDSGSESESEFSRLIAVSGELLSPAGHRRGQCQDLSRNSIRTWCHHRQSQSQSQNCRGSRRWHGISIRVNLGIWSGCSCGFTFYFLFMLFLCLYI